MQAKLYFEAHITIDPVPEEQRPVVQTLGNPWGFKLAKLLMQKGEPSKIDTFMTAHGGDSDDVGRRVRGMVIDLQRHGFNVRRYKVEDTLYDSRSEDVLGLLAMPQAIAPKHQRLMDLEQRA
jgi:hypothetical protein